MASDKMLGSFDQKSAPEDNDLLVEYDAAASKVKNVKFGGVWNWIVKKLTSAVINELQTSSKNVVGAINELNSNPSINAIHTVKQGILNSNGELKFSSPFNSFCIFSYHDNEGLPGGVAIFTTAFSPNVIKHASHNGGLFVIEGTTNEGYTIKTNTPNGKYRIIISKNYD